VNTIVSLFASRARDDGTRPALHVKRDGRFHAVTWNELAGDVRRTAAALLTLGVEPGDRVVQVSENRYEWIVMDLAIQMARAIHVSVDPPLTGAQIAWRIADCDARLVIVSTPEQAGRLAASADRLPDTLTFLSIDPCAVTIGSQPVGRLGDAVARANQRGDAAARRVQRDALAWLTPDSVATILYTSGTTGQPRGVMLSQGNLVSNALAKVQAHAFDRSELRLGILPLSHIFGRTCDLYTTIASGSQLALAGSRQTLLGDCSAVSPTYINAVPYFFDKCYRNLCEAGRADEPGSLRKLLGGNIRTCLCGGAPLPDRLYDFFWHQGVPVLQGYGLTESSPVIADCTLTHNKKGTVGRPIPGVEVRIAADGEILTRGPHVMVGYWNNRQATDEAIRNGWLHTGDVGRLDEDGLLRITGRKKEIIVTAGGRNIAPGYLEALLTEDALILQAMVVGDGRNYLAALIVPDREAVDAEMAARSRATVSDEEIFARPETLSLLMDRIAKRLADVSHHEQVRRFAVVPRPFTLERGELTAKQSLRRHVIAAHYTEQIEAMYRPKPE